MLEDGGLFKLNQINPDYQTEYLPKIYYGKGDFKGIAIGASTQYPDVDGYMFAYYHTTGARQKVAFQGKNGDAKSDSLIEAQRKELDANKRIAIIQDWQRYMATKMLMIPFPGQAETFTLSWPWTGNFGVWRAWDAENAADETTIYTWFDKAKFTG
jgi:ABC-type transport system substrate-binding protein